MKEDGRKPSNLPRWILKTGTGKNSTKMKYEQQSWKMKCIYDNKSGILVELSVTWYATTTTSTKIFGYRLE